MRLDEAERQKEGRVGAFARGLQTTDPFKGDSE
jgi:hypothetical protein